MHRVHDHDAPPRTSRFNIVTHFNEQLPLGDRSNLSSPRTNVRRAGLSGWGSGVRSTMKALISFSDLVECWR